MKKHSLILDAGGVIIEDLSVSFWHILAAKSTLPALDTTKLYAQYKLDVSEQLWTGKINEQQLLQFLETFGIVLTPAELNEIIKGCLLPLPAYEKVKVWSSKVPIYIMSNHVSSWLMPALAPLQPFITDFYISDAYKVKKPTGAWFEHITDRLQHTSIMFVDNTMHNIEAAKQVGWNTIYADADHKWIDEVESWLVSIEV